MSQARNVAVLFGLGLWIVACGSKPTVTGVVQDTHGALIENATAMVTGSTTVAESDASGTFLVSYMAGVHQVVISKNGYLSETIEVDTTATEQVDVGTIQLQRTPPEKGLFLFDAAGFTAIGRVPVDKTARGLHRNYCLPDGLPPFTEVPAGELAFFDWSQIDRHLIRLQDKDGKKCAGVGAGSPRYETIVDDDLHETVDELTDDMKLRRVNLPKGEYIYADWTNGWFRSEGSAFVVQ